MRWGVRDESTDDHSTLDLCLKELKACQELSTGPNFVVNRLNLILYPHTTLIRGEKLLGSYKDFALSPDLRLKDSRHYYQCKFESI